MKDLAGKVAVITGAASGIGKALAERLARDGMKLVLADVDEPALQSVAAALGGSGGQVLARRVDVSKADQVEALAAAAYERFGAVNLLCNNAGVGAGGFTWECSLPEWEWVLGVNLWGVIHGVRSFVPRMLAGGQPGHLVNTASVAGLLSVAAMTPYNVSKHGVVTLSESLFHELAMASGGRIGVSVLCPGWVNTRIAESHRNLPAAAAAEATARLQSNPVAAKMAEMLQQQVAGGIPASQVADAVVSAVQEERFYILTHPAMTADVRRRLEAIVEGRPPAASVPR
jgi:NAD(P)-dependent dehydrogenase (short-subunit alcohol dehydrogenase family)